MHFFVVKVTERNRRYYLRKKSKELTCKMQDISLLHHQEGRSDDGNTVNTGGVFIEQTVEVRCLSKIEIN